MVKMVKRCLRKVLRKSKLNFDEFVTVLKEIQCILNNRPLTYLYTDEVNETLTPYKLLYGRDIHNEIRITDNDESQQMEPTEQLQRIGALSDNFWKA